MWLEKASDIEQLARIAGNSSELKPKQFRIETKIDRPLLSP